MATDDETRAKFYREVQDSGWHLERCGKSDVIGRCPAEGCGMRAQLKLGEPVPQVDPDWRRSGLDRAIEDYEDAADILRYRREELGLRIHEVEDMVGVATDYFAKAEKRNPTKIPNTATFIAWANALGYDVVLRPNTGMARGVVRVVAETRDRMFRRWRRSRVDRVRRGQDRKVDLSRR